MIGVNNLVTVYPGEAGPTINGLSFTVSPGELLWVSGPSGSGKSTLLNLVGLLTPASSGSYSLDGVDMTTATAARRGAARRDTLSMVFQRGNLFPHLTALDNVLLGMTTPDEATARRALDAVHMGAHATHQAGLLSGGEQNRVAFARATARGTPVLLADEPLAGLDDDAVAAVLGVLRDFTEAGATVVVVSHDPRAAAIAHQHVALERAS